MALCYPRGPMSVARLHELLHHLPADGRITLGEVQALIDAATDEGKVTVGEVFVLQAALDAHREKFTPEAFQALKGFLQGAG